MTSRLFGVALILLSATVAADTLQGRVVSIADGDTVTILDASQAQHKIRLLGIDAPERKQPFGHRSKEHLSDLMFNKQVSVEYSKQDRYGRTVGKVLVNGTDANLEQIKAGMAWHYKAYQREQSAGDRAAYTRAEEQAREGQVGLWVDSDPMAPWDWRKAQKAKR